MELDWLRVNAHVHTVIGSLTLLGGAIALWTAKGSRPHVRGGWLFVWTMPFVIVTSLLAMLHEFLPLAIVLALAEAYLVPSALLSVNRHWRGFRGWTVALMAIPGLLGLFSFVQFVRINLGPAPFFLGPLAMAAMFWFLFVQDWRMLRRPPSHRNAWLRRHLLRMVLAFTIAIMALVRIGIRFGLTLEASVLVPLAVAALAILWMYRRWPVPPQPHRGRGMEASPAPRPPE